MPGPLDGIRVVEFGGLGPAPFAAMVLADAGADVVRIDRPAGPVDGGALLRGRPWIGLDLKADAGLATARALVDRADVLLEGFRPGVMERLGLGPEPCRAANPGLVYGRMTGWGQDGPRAHQAGHDINYLALTGALRSIARRGEAPVPPLNLVGDYGGGGMLLVVGVLTALLARGRDGRGQVVDAAMVDGVSLLMTGVWSRAAQGRWQGEPGTNDIDTGAPFYDVYATADGEYMAVGSIEPAFWRALLEGLGIDPAEVGEQWDRARWPHTKERLAAAFATRTRAEWTERFDRVDACVTPVLHMAEAARDEHLTARGTLVPDGDGHPGPAPAPRLGGTPLAAVEPADLDSVLRRWDVATPVGAA
ncbi:CaiB/BaiF CoA transferase family protein [Actinomycetospora termitidis]|uniref:CaiB/BaiF CoA-transferase family protein n=1 Tax=Actinomycetospora termitidis TaxID=3053470 RepID=A0ABT7M6B7_9PSEU|nr:CaiB/BaiF CoA-transferase family protein [Actinomycetospora sp. Odt1-22]MDL5155607.1 CaiB/BaiF CoA-transferase family protein [Actinomycetospora sp. Odt1-22]